MNRALHTNSVLCGVSRDYGDVAQGYMSDFIFTKLQIGRLSSIFNQAFVALMFGLIAAGSLFSAQAQALAPGAAVGWGRNDFGQTTIPADLTGVTAIAAGANHSLALKVDGTVVGWGDNTYGETTIPTGLSGVTAIASGNYQSLALKSDGTVVAWGYNVFGESTVPTGLTGVTAIAAGANFGLALKADGTVVGWGNNMSGQTTLPTGLTGVTAIAAGGLHSLALKNDGTVVAWGSNQFGAATVPAGLTGVTAIAARFSHSLALKSDGTVVAWGDNTFGQTTPPPGLTGVTAIAAGGYHSLALRSDGTVVAWGYNVDGETTVPPGLTGVTAIAAGVYHNLAANAFPQLRSFSAFAPFLTITKGIVPNSDGFGFGATLTLGSNGKAFDAIKDTVTLQLGTSAPLTIPAGAFKPNGFGGFAYFGKIGAMPVGATLQPQGGGKYVIGIGESGANLAGVANPVAVNLTIGPNQGKTSVSAYFSARKSTSPEGNPLASPFAN